MYTLQKYYYRFNAFKKKLDGEIGEALNKGNLEWSSPPKVVHLIVWEIEPIQLLKGGLKWPRKDTDRKKS